MRILWVKKFVKIQEFLRILKMAMNSKKNKIRYRDKITDRMKILNANVVNRISCRREQYCNVSSADIGLLVHKMCIAKFKHKNANLKLVQKRIFTNFNEFVKITVTHGS